MNEESASVPGAAFFSSPKTELAIASRATASPITECRRGVGPQRPRQQAACCDASRGWRKTTHLQVAGHQLASFDSDDRANELELLEQHVPVVAARAHEDGPAHGERARPVPSGHPMDQRARAGLPLSAARDGPDASAATVTSDPA
jgi:hypothetical protein